MKQGCQSFENFFKGIVFMSDFIIDPVNKGVYSLFLIKEEKQPYIYSGHTYPRSMAQIQFFTMWQFWASLIYELIFRELKFNI